MSKKSKEPVENIYDLSKIGGQIDDIKVDANTSKYDQDALLVGYTLVPPDKWSNVSSGSHIRYLRKDGEFRKGGIVTAVYATKDTEGNDTIKFDLISNYGPTAVKWSIYKGSIEKIWAKEENRSVSPVASPRVNTDVSDMKKDMVFCRNAIEDLRKEIQKITNEQMRTIVLIKKLHNIK